MSSAAPSARLLAGRQLSSHITSFAHSIRTSAEAATHATTGVGSEIPHIQNYPQKQPVRAKYGHCRFTPTDDRQLLGCHSYEELCGAIESIILETGYSRRSVIERAKALEVWAKFAPHRRITTIQEKVSVQKLLARSDVEVDLLSVVASKLNLDRSTARRRVYKDSAYIESLNEGTYSAREVAQGLCVRRATIKRFVVDGLLRAKRFQPAGKLYITSDSIADFVRSHPRFIDWDRCMRNSPWLKDILEDVRVKELTKLLCVQPKTLRAWMDHGLLKLPFNRKRLSNTSGRGRFWVVN